MDEKQLLDAIRGIIREETESIVTKKLAEQTTTLEERMTKIEVSYENNTRKILNLLQEDYSRVAQAAAKTEDYDEVRDTVKDHDRALKNHNQRITELEKKAI